ncbi:MAG: hypothetical protein OHK0028_04620 [Deltaproteobacteria bacterium]
MLMNRALQVNFSSREVPGIPVFRGPPRFRRKRIGFPDAIQELVAKGRRGRCGKRRESLRRARTQMPAKSGYPNNSAWVPVRSKRIPSSPTV